MIYASVINGELAQVWPCCEHCEHGEAEGKQSYHTEPCWCQEGLTDQQTEATDGE